MGNFLKNIGQFLVKGLGGWLMGAMGNLNVQFPKDLNPKGIMQLVLQMSGITYENVRNRLAQKVGEEVVATAEKGFSLLQNLRKKGPLALWNQLKTQAGEIKHQFIKEIRNWVIVRVVRQAIVKLLAMLNPSSAIVQGIISIYNILMFFWDNLPRIVGLAKAVFNSITAIAAGNIATATKFYP